MSTNKKIAAVAAVFISIVAIVTVWLTATQVAQERAQLVVSLQSRSALLLSGLGDQLEPGFASLSMSQLKQMVSHYAARQRVAAILLVSPSGQVIASSSGEFARSKGNVTLAANVMDDDTPAGNIISVNNKSYYAYAAPLHGTGQHVAGIMVVDQAAAYVSQQLDRIWLASLVRFFLEICLVGLALLILLRWAILTPIQTLADALRQIRLNSEASATTKFLRNPLLRPLLREIRQLQQSLIKARRAASEEAKMSLEKLDSPWTEERLKEFTKVILKDRSIISVSSLEPYVHSSADSESGYHVPASGLVTAVEPVMQATGGTWVARATGDGDKAAVDDQDKVRVPPDDPKYTLKRVWLTDAEEDGFAKGVCDQALYPLFHMAHVRPIFRKEDWEQYKKVNGKFAEIILSEIKHLTNPVIFIQDFQFTLLPRMIKNSRPDATIGIFWHIPWISSETFSICPWKKEILDGMLGADLLGFHTQLHCNNFIETVAHELESLIDREHDTIQRNEHISLVRPFQASVTFSGRETGFSADNLARSEALRRQLGITSRYVGLGVDRLDYIKGVGERLTALEIFFRDNPKMRERFTFVQVSSPPEKPSKQNDEVGQKIEQQVQRINALYATKSWKPVIFLKRRHSHEEVADLYRIADVCMVTSLHDGMNLVAKEYIATRNDERGVLIVSQFAGAAAELAGAAIVVNPYNAEQSAEAIMVGLTMSSSEQAKRMRKLRTTVRNYNVYRWSAEILKAIASLS